MVDQNGDIYLGVPEGFARVELLPGNKWAPRHVAAFPPDATADTVSSKFAAEAGGEWFWWSDSGPVYAWQPGTLPRVAGRTENVGTVLGIDDVVYLSDSSQPTVQSWKDRTFSASPSVIPTQSDSLLTTSVQIPGADTWIGTVDHGLFQYSKSAQEFIPAKHPLCDGSQRIRAIHHIKSGHLAIAVDTVGIVFTDEQGNILQVLDRNVDYRLARPLAILSTPGGIVWALLSDGIACVLVFRVGFRSLTRSSILSSLTLNRNGSKADFGSSPTHFPTGVSTMRRADS